MEDKRITYEVVYIENKKEYITTRQMATFNLARNLADVIINNGYEVKGILEVVVIERLIEL